MGFKNVIRKYKILLIVLMRVIFGLSFMYYYWLMEREEEEEAATFPVSTLCNK
jgi:flagellar basal body-associated protein FliL